MKKESAWKHYAEADIEQLERIAQGYIDFISNNKTERECVSAAILEAQKRGYRALPEVVEKGETLCAGDKVYAEVHGKALMLVTIGEAPISEGMNILGAHVDSPRLDIKQNPLYETKDFAFLDTHYYGGIKTYQWVTLPLAIHGVVVTSEGKHITVNVGEDPNDPVFCVTDLLIHLGAEQMKKEASQVVEGEALDILVGNRMHSLAMGAGCALEVADGEAASASEGDADADLVASSASESPAASSEKDASGAASEPVKAYLLELLAQKYGMEERDFLSSELEVVPAGRAREMGFDRSMVLGYGQDDRVCVYPSLLAQLEVENPYKTTVTLLVDKEEIGSVGASGMESLFFENTLLRVFERARWGGMLEMREALAASAMLSSDVMAGFDPAYPNVFEEKNTSFLGYGFNFSKYTGARGKSGSNDARAEYLARIRRVMDENKVRYQTSELGRVNAGGGGTIAYLLARYGMDVIDAGVPVLSMHAPWEVTSKADIYEAYKGYVAFLRDF